MRAVKVLVLLALVGGCNMPTVSSEGPEDATQALVELHPETSQQQVTESARHPLDIDEHWVTNPTSGAQLWVGVVGLPPGSSELLPAVVLVPGGTGDSGRFIESNELAVAYLRAGIVAVVFDPDGRGNSEGEEDFNGFIHQDGLAAVISYVVELPGIDPERIGLVSHSYGVTMAAGTLARYPDLPIQFFIDWEGPVDREDTTVGCTGAPQEFARCSDDAFWAEREALTFIVSVQVPYQRVQSERDHVQPDVSHAIHVVNAAVESGVAWVRLNELPANQTYDSDSPPPMLAEQESRNITRLVLEYVVDLFAILGEE